MSIQPFSTVAASSVVSAAACPVFGMAVTAVARVARGG